MKKKILLSIGICLIFSFSFSQQVENGSFEDWEEVGLGPDIIEPVNWSTIKTSDNPSISNLAPITWERSTDAHSGQYSVRLHNTSTLGIPVSGTMSNGQYHPNLNTELAYAFTNTADPQWNTPYTWRPDSIAFWVKWFPDGDDTLQFQALLHVGEATLPPNPENEANRVAYTRADIGDAFENWTRISLAFEYFDNRTPEYLLMIITSGNGTTPNVGSYAYYDDIEIIGGQAIYENPLEQVSISFEKNTLHIRNLPENLRKQSTLNIIDLVGRPILHSKLYSNEIAIEPALNLDGIYLLKISSADYIISRKIYIKTRGF